MPQQEEFWNPYRFVPMPNGSPGRQPPRYHHRLDGTSGVLVCRLEARTALLLASQTGGNDVRTFWTNRARVPTIPGTSIKGMLRSVAEIVGHGCDITSNHGCSDPNRLCPTCRLFGFVGRGQESALYRGHVHIGDAPLDNSSCASHAQWERSGVYMSSPRPNHRAFYPSNASKGRKLYHHQPRQKNRAAPIRPDIPGPNCQLQPAPAGAAFDFVVRFEDLDADQLGLLLYTLVLEPESQEVTVTGWQSTPPGDVEIVLTGPMCHKLGHGKPYGLGSCQITIQEARLVEGGDRYRGGGRSKLTGQDLETWIREQTATHEGSTTTTMEALRRMMVFDENDPREVCYPSRAWFNDNGQRPLKPV